MAKQTIDPTDTLPQGQTKINANFTELYGRANDGVIARATANQSLPATTPTKIVFGTKDRDVNNRFTNNEYTVPVTGWYLVSANITISVAVSFLFQIDLYVGGVQRKRLATHTTHLVGATEYSWIAEGLFYFTAGDILSIYTVGSAASTVQTGSGTPQQPTFTILPLG